MNERTKTGLEIIQAAVLLGLLGDVLLRATPWGINVLLFVGALIAALAMLFLRRRHEFWNSQTIALNGALILLAAMYVWRDSRELHLFDGLMMLGILAVQLLPALKIQTRLAGVIHYAVAGAWMWMSAAFAPFFLIFDDVKWTTIPQTGWTKHLIAVLRGLAIAVPILLVFGGLFVAADAVYQGIVERTLNINFENLVSHVFLIGVFAWLTAGYLRGALFGFGAAENGGEAKKEAPSQILSVTEIKEDEPAKPAAKPDEPEKTWTWQNLDNSVLPRGLTLGAIEISIILGLINLLFLSFVLVQLPYLFGGFELVQNTPDFKLAEYARRGFGELVTVAALVLPILMTSHWLLRRDAPVNEKIYRALAGIQIVLLFVIMASAMQRLFILTGNLGYGLTTVRFYPMAFMVWLAIVFIWFTATVLRGARQHFTWGALWSAVLVLVVLHVWNPDGYIARTNLRLMREGRSFDPVYNSRLSDDAIPALVENLDAMNFADQCIVKRQLVWRLGQANGETDVRSWNYSRWAGRRTLKTFYDSFDTSNCPEPTRISENREEF